MWTVIDLDRNEPLRARSFSLRTLLAQVERPDRAGPLVRRAMESNDPRIERVWDSIPTWLTRAENIDLDGLGYLEQIDRLPFLRLDSEEHDLHCDIWIEDELVVVQKPAGARRLLFMYEPNPDDESWNASERLASFSPTATFLEVYSHTGDESVDSRDQVPFGPQGRVRRAIAYVRAYAGAVISRVVRKTVMRKRHRTNDPFWERRFRKLEARNPDLADAIPILPPPASLVPTALPPAGAMKELVVLVHGTVSAGMRMAAAIFPDLKSGHPPFVKAWPRVLRFEHDTFASCEVNATELQRRVEQYRGLVDSVLLLAHSRGGLVAASAAHELQAATGVKPMPISVHTFGTPHAGTPLVLASENAGDLVSDLLQMGGEVAGHAMGHDALGWIAGQAAADLAGFPQGVSDMEVGNSYLLQGLKRQFAAGTEAIAWSAEFDPKDPAAKGTRFGRLLQKGAILFDPNNPDEVPNDGVVPVASANHPRWQHKPILKNCDHSAYFDRLAARLRTRIGP